MLFTDCAALLCLTGTTGRLLDQPILVPVQVQKRNNVLKFTSLKNIEYSAWSIFFRKLMSHLVRSATTSASRGACLYCFSKQYNCVYLWNWSKLHFKPYCSPDKCSLFIIYSHSLRLKTAVTEYFVSLSFSFLNVLLTEARLPGLAWMPDTWAGKANKLVGITSSCSYGRSGQPGYVVYLCR